MTHKERVLITARHQEPDRVPLFYRDVPEIEERLTKDLGLRDREELLRYFDIDFRWVEPRYVGPSLRDDDPGYIRDIWGVEYRYVLAGHGGYWEPLAFPLIDVQDAAALDDYPWPDVRSFDFSVLDTQLKKYEGYAIMTAPGEASPGVLCTIQNLLGMERALTDMLLNPDFYHALIKKILEFELPFLERLFAAAGDRIDFFRIGDDFGSQQGLLMSPELWHQFMQPALKAMSAIAKRHGAFYYHHSCGAVSELIPLLIKTGVDVLDPLQVGAKGMVPSSLKTEFGHEICFSGGVDEQELLPNGTPEQVRDGVQSLLDIMARGGGFFVGPTHNFQCDIPTQNIVAMYEAARNWRY
jgi:uroporphyrinogen decarboxylase